jgi:DNA-binding transcriptional LysR family regulator
MKDLEMRHLESFLVVAEEGSFTRAALRLNITQPPLSLRIQQLEALLKVRLFDRTNKYIRITPAGRVFREELQGAMNSIEAAIESARQADRGVVGSLRVGYTGITTDLVLLKLIRRFRSLHPKIALDVRGPSSTGELELRLINEELDVALCFLPLPHKALESHTLVTTDLAIVLPSKHPMARAKKISLATLAEEPFIAYPATGGFHLRAASDAACAKAGFRARVIKESRSPQSVLSLIAAGTGIAILPRDHKLRATDGLVFRELIPDMAPVQYGMAWRKTDDNPCMVHFLTAAIDLFSGDKVRPGGRISARLG